MQKRSYWDIIAEILLRSKKGVNKTRIVYRCNLNFKILEKYLKDLKYKGLVKIGDGVIKTTKKGIEYLNRYDALYEMLSNEKMISGKDLNS